MKTNVAMERPKLRTHEGAPAKRIDAEAQLRRSVMSCLLWEKEFYESGVTIADRIATLVPQVEPFVVARMAIQARSEMNLRHVPLLLVREMAKHPMHKAYVASTLAGVIQRPDELAEFVSLYWKDGKRPLSAQIKKGLAAAFAQFNEYSFAKYKGDGNAIKLRDVMFLVHPKPVDAVLYKKIADNTLATPDTWEVALSSGADKRETWERLMSENALGGLALLRNLRNMEQVGVSKSLIRIALAKMNTTRILPFRFIAAAKYAPEFEPELEAALFRSLDGEKMTGRTVVLIDVSGSMEAPLSAKSDMTRMDAACGVAMVAREICDDVAIYTFSQNTVKVPARRGFALRDAVVNSQGHGGTYLGKALRDVNAVGYDRLIVITDEQSHDVVGNPVGKLAYLINVASAQNGVGYGAFTHIDGFSEAVIRYIQEVEKG